MTHWLPVKRSDSATGSPLTLSGYNLGPIICVFHFGEEREAQGGQKMKAAFTTFHFFKGQGLNLVWLL